MIAIFTDIDGVLNPHWRTEWDRNAIGCYNRLCKDLGLMPVITSTWRLAHTKEQLQRIFAEQGIDVEIHDYTPHMDRQDRGVEIKAWIDENGPDDYVVIDDRVHDIEPYVGNVVKCRSWIGLTEEECDLIREMLVKN